MLKLVDGVPVEMTEEQVAAEFPPHPPAPVPQMIEMRKAKLQMLATPWPAAGEGATLLDAVEAAIAASSRELQIEYAGTTLSRTRDVVVGLQAAFGIDDATMDALFLAANARP
jgi:hypothetical protein